MEPRHTATRRGATTIVTTADRATRPDVVDVVCLGESMVTFLPSPAGPPRRRALLRPRHRRRRVQRGLRARRRRAPVRWVSRVGADGFGDHLVEAIAAYGVDVSAVGRDPARPTGIYFRTARRPGHTRTRHDAKSSTTARGSAASAMSPGDRGPGGGADGGRILHLSGITAALSDDCLALMRELTARAPGRPLVSFDVNYRAGLWRDADGPRVLLDLARGADLVFVGEDEAEAPGACTGGLAPRAAGAGDAGRQARARRGRCAAPARRRRGRPTRGARREPAASTSARPARAADRLVEAAAPPPSSPPSASTSSRPSAPATPSPPGSSPPPCAASPYATGSGTATSWPPPPSPSPATSPHPPPATTPTGWPPWTTTRGGDFASAPAGRSRTGADEEVRTP